MAVRSNTNNNGRETNVLLLGGYGNTGRVLARLLVQNQKIDHLIVAGRNLQRAQEFIREAEFHTGNGYGSTKEDKHFHDTPRVSALRVDASDPWQQLAAVFQQHSVTLLVVACSSNMTNLAQAAIHAKIDMMDLQYSRQKTQDLKELESEIKQAGCCFITECGFHPGLPAALIRYMHMVHPSEQITSAIVSSVIRLDWKHLETDLSPETMRDFAVEFADFSTLSYQNGTWKSEGFMFPKNVKFGPPFGNQPVISMYLDELQELPVLYPHLKDTGFYVGSLNCVVDWILSPIVLLALACFPRSARVQRAMGRLLHWGLRAFSKPPYGTVLRVETKGGRHHHVVTISHQDGYALTAIPVAATVQQYLDDDDGGTNNIRKPGLWLQGLVVDPVRLLHDMENVSCDQTDPVSVSGHGKHGVGVGILS